LPVVPFLCIAAAWLVVAAVRAIAREATPGARSGLRAGAAIAMVAPTARDTLLLDRLLATTDNRVIVARALVDIIPPENLVYQSGETYGHVPLGIDGRQAGRVSRFDQATGRFRPADPDWILVQRSPLVLYSAVPPWLDRLLTDRYVLVRTFPIDAGVPSVRVYDQQDAFYL